MALKKTIDFKGISVPSSYSKVTRIEIFDYINNDGENPIKKYSAIISVSCYSDNTKEHKLSDNRHKIDWDDSPISYSEAYDQLKLLDEFTACESV